jgi:hypothetical protein
MARNIVNWLSFYKIELLVIVFGIFHQITQKIFAIKLPWFDNYGDDFLAVPFVAGIVLIAENILIYKNHERKHHFLQLAFIFILISIVFEFLLPNYSAHYFYDPIDIIYYLLGFLIYYYIKKSR